MKKSLMFSVAALLSVPAALLSGSAVAAEAASHTTLKNCVIQEVVPGKDMTGAYATFVHTGAPVKLKSAEVPTVSPRVELHEMVMQNGVMEMGPLKDLTIKEGERVFKKGADHVMLFDVTNRPAIGSTHKLIVHFEDGSQASCDAVVKSVKDVMKDAGMSEHGHGDHHGAKKHARSARARAAAHGHGDHHGAKKH